MKTRIFIGMLLLILALESCSRGFTPYQAANSPRGKRCGVIR